MAHFWFPVELGIRPDLRGKTPLVLAGDVPISRLCVSFLLQATKRRKKIRNSFEIFCSLSTSARRKLCPATAVFLGEGGGGGRDGPPITRKNTASGAIASLRFLAQIFSSSFENGFD